MFDEPADRREREIDCIASTMVEELIDDVTLGVCFEAHRAAKQGYLFIDDDGEE